MRVAAQIRRGGGGRLVQPQGRDQLVGADDVVRPEQQTRQEQSLFDWPERNRVAVSEHTQGAKQFKAKRHHVVLSCGGGAGHVPIVLRLYAGYTEMTITSGPLPSVTTVYSAQGGKW